MVPGGTNYSAVDSPGGLLLGETTYSMTVVIASFQVLHHFPLHEEFGQPGIFPHMCDVKGKMVVKRT